MIYITQVLGFKSSIRLLLLSIQMQYWLMSVMLHAKVLNTTLIQAFKRGSNPSPCNPK